MEGETLSSIKYKYDIAKEELSIFIAIINSMYIRSAENINFELFNEALINLKLNSLSNTSIENIISDANLYLNEEERIRFFKLCKREFDGFVQDFNNVCETCQNRQKLNEEDDAQIEAVYYKNYIGIIDFPLYGDFSRKKMIAGIQKQFILFGKEIMKLEVPTDVICMDIKEYIHNYFRELLHKAQNQETVEIKEHPNDNTVVYSQFMTDKELYKIDFPEFFRVLNNGEISVKHLYAFLDYLIETNQIERLFEESTYFQTNRLNKLAVVISALKREDYRNMEIVKDNGEIMDNTNTKKDSKGEVDPYGPQTFPDIFNVENYIEYLDLLINTEPPLLNKTDDGKYRFIGGQNKQRGLVAAYFKLLKDRGIINNSINRKKLAEILSREITNYRISPASIDNTSNYWYKTYLKKIEIELKRITPKRKND